MENAETDFQKKPDITNTLPDLIRLGINAFEFHSSPRDKSINIFIAEELKKIKKNFLKKLPEGYVYSRKMYRNFKIDPTRHRPSSEALWRRLHKYDDFPRVNPAVDLTNLLALKFQTSFGLYDMQSLKGPVLLRAGRENEGYEGIRKGWLPMARKIVLADDSGPFGNPSADSLRTRVTPEARLILQVLFFHPLDPQKTDNTAKAAAAFTALFPCSLTFSGSV